MNGWPGAGIELVRSLAGDGLTIVMIEYIMHAIRSLWQRVAVLNAGRVIGSGRPEEALANRDVIRVYLDDSLRRGP